MTLEQYYGEKLQMLRNGQQYLSDMIAEYSGEKDGGRDSADSLYKFSNQSAGKPDAKIAEKRTAGGL
mgnify:FL=1